MRVAVLTQYFPTSRQPWAGHSAYQTLRVLAEWCELQVFFPEAVYPSALAPKTWSGPLDRTWQPKGVAVEYIPYGTLPLISRPLNGELMARKLFPAVERFKPDVILNYVVYPDGWAAVRIGRKLRTPVVLTAIGSDLNRISDPLCGLFTRSALRQADRVITVSHHLGETAVGLGAEKGRVFPVLNGCDTSIFHPRETLHARQGLTLDPNAKLAVYIGRSDVRKGLMELLDAFMLLKRDMPQAQLVLVGDGPDKPLLEQKIEANGARDSVRLLPSCPTEQVAQWMAAADTVVLPSYAEGCPNVVIEALCSGRPVVASNVGGIPELMDYSSGRLVPSKDVAELAKALSEVLHQQWNADEIAAKHRRSWVDVADDVFQVLADAIRSAAADGSIR